jgi:glycosyltransferase involved in cell wall biosynthesis
MNIWIFQSGEPLHSDNDNSRPMRAMNLANTLTIKGHNVVIWSSGFYHQKKIQRAKSYKKIFINKKLEIRLIPSPGYKKNISIQRLFDHFMLAYNLKKKLEVEKNLPDVAFIGYPPIETAFIMTSWLKKKKIPYLLDVQDQWPSIFVESVPKILRAFIRLILLPYFLIAKKTFKGSSGICAMSKSFIDWSINFSNRKRSKYDIIVPLTSPYDKLTSLEKKRSYSWWSKKSVVSNNIFRVIFIGSFSRAFDFELILKTAKTLSIQKINCEFILCGSGELNRELRTNSEKYQNIKIIEWIDKSKIFALSKLSSVYIAPYKNDQNFISNIPNKISDAFKFGLPLLSPLKGEVENLIKNYNAGIVYTDYLSLADNIKLLISNPNLHKKISNNAKKLYQNKFEFNKVYSRLIKNLENLQKANNER